MESWPDVKLTPQTKQTNKKRVQMACVRDQSLITERGGVVLQNRKGGEQVKFYPYGNARGGGAGAKQVLAMLMGAHKKFWGSKTGA